MDAKVMVDLCLQPVVVCWIRHMGESASDVVYNRFLVLVIKPCRVRSVSMWC